MVQETVPAAKRRLNAHGRTLRRARIFTRLREGLPYAAIAGEEGLTPRRVRQIVSEALQKRGIDPASDHALMQLERPLTKSRARGQRKPLKRLDSDKENKANPKAFLWQTAFWPRTQAPKSGSVRVARAEKRICARSPQAFDVDKLLNRPRRRRRREAPPNPLDLVRGNANGQTQDALLVAPRHDLSVFVEPMQPLPVAGVKGEFDHRPSASQPILDRRHETIDPFPSRGGDGERRRLPHLLLLDERGARALIETVEFVPGLNDAVGAVGDADLGQNRVDVMALRIAVTVGYVAHVDNDVRTLHLFERGPEGGNERRRQIRDEADRVGEDRRAAVGQLDEAHGRIEGGKQHVGRHDFGAGQPIEQCRLPGVSVADQSDNRIGDRVAARAMQGAPALHSLQLPLAADDALLNKAAVGFDLGFARSAEKAESAALTFEMGPRTHKAGALIAQMGQLHLQRALGGARPAAKNFEDEPGAVDDLAVEGLFEVTLLRRGQRAVHHDKIDPLGLHFSRYGFDLALAEVGRRAERVQRHGFGARDYEIDGAR